MLARSVSGGCFVGGVFLCLGGWIFGADIDDPARLRVDQDLSDILAPGLYDVERPDERVMFVFNFRAFDFSIGNFFERDFLRLHLGNFGVGQEIGFARGGENGERENRCRQSDGEKRVLIFFHAPFDTASGRLFNRCTRLITARVGRLSET